MAVMRSDILKSIERQTGYNSKVCREVFDACAKNILEALAYSYEHKVILQNFLVIEMKDGFDPESNRKSPMGDPINPNNKRVVATLTSNLKRQISRKGIERTLEDVWGIPRRKGDSVNGVGDSKR